MPAFTAEQQALIDQWEAHTAAEFELKDADAAIATMTDNPSLIHVPVGTGASGREALRAFYRDILIPQAPPDFTLRLLSRTVGQNRVIDEFIATFTHSLQMDWFAPGIAATGRSIAVPHVAVIAFEGGKISSEHIYWDHASTLRQLGLLGEEQKVLGDEQQDRLLDPSAPAYRLIS